MKLSRVQITEFQSIRDSTEFEVGDITCLVGKNEAGKTAVLQAIYRLNPVVGSGTFDVTDDYPRADVEDYRRAVDEGEREPANVVTATFKLEEPELAAIAQDLGDNVVPRAELRLCKGYDNERRFGLTVNEGALQQLIKKSGLPPESEAKLAQATNAPEALASLAGVEQTSAVQQLTAKLNKIKERGLNGYIYDTYLQAPVPKFLYFDEYYQMRGYENIEQLKQRQIQHQLRPSDYPMLGLVALARLNLDELLNPHRTQELVNKLEGAGNHLSKRILKYWSQNKHLEMRFDVRPARPGDPEGMRSGTNVWAGVYDSRHKVTTSVGTRSQGFVWFFSFLAWYSEYQRKNDPLILLLDEPGLFLHAKAQEDLLRYFEQELRSAHQVMYTTHSPFMVDPRHWERARIVQDKGIDTLDPLPPDQEGTKVFADVLEASSDSLFPLQAALGYEIHQTLFIGPNSLIVEGSSDLLYLQAMTSVLEQSDREGLSEKWTITPVGGADKVPTFVALIGAQHSLNLATLIDIDKGNEQTIENLYKRKLLTKKKVLTYGDFTGTKYADAEDMFDVDFYLDLVNEEYKASLPKLISESDLTSKAPRIVRRLEEYFASIPLKGGTVFNHFRPARLFTERAGALRAKLSDGTLKRFEKAFKRLNALLPD
jgi:predicted ATPase